MKIKKVYLGRRQIYPDWWSPGTNTIAYYKFDWDLNDSSGNNRNLTIRSWTFTYWTTSWWASYTILNRSQWTNYIDLPFSYTAYTVNVWIKWYTTYSNTWGICVEYRWGEWPRIQWWKSWYTLQIEWTTNPYRTTDTDWHLVSYVYNNNVKTLYIDWVYYESKTISWSKTSVRFLLNNAWDTNSSSYAWYAYVSDIINESKARTAEEISDYYNKTKGNYWL